MEGDRMDKRTAVIDASMKRIEQMIALYPDDKYDNASSAFRYFAEHVIGLSASRLLPHLIGLVAKAGAGEVDPDKVCLTSVHQDLPAIRVLDENGNWFGAAWDRNEKDVTNVMLFAFDSAELDYPYPERVASASIVDQAESFFCCGHCTLGYFGSAVGALAALHRAVGSPTFSDDHEGPNASMMMTMSDYNLPLSTDGGIAGEICREIGIRTNHITTANTMERADRHFAEIADGLRNAGATWGNRYLQWNDLDNAACLLPAGANGETSIIHFNSSLTSAYRSYVLSKHPDGDLSLYALKGNSQDFASLKKVLLEGGDGLTPIAIRRGGETIVRDPFDTTDVIDFMGHGIRWIREIVVKGEAADSDFKSDWSTFETAYEEDFDPGDIAAGLTV
jgi:hypothetical protein